MTNGFIIQLFDKIILLLKHFNLVEYFKKICIGLTSLLFSKELTGEEKRQTARIAVDVFIMAKFILVFCLVVFEASQLIWKFLVLYLIWSNLFTYFYYHIWGSPYKQSQNLEAQRGRFTNFVLAIAFYIFSYAYLFQFHYACEVEWPDDVISYSNAIFISFANSFTLTYGGYSPLTHEARMLFLGELLNTVFFVTIIVANSLPTRKED